MIPKEGILCVDKPLYTEKPNLDGFYDVKVSIEFKPTRPYKNVIDEITMNQFNTRLNVKAYKLAEWLRDKLTKEGVGSGWVKE